MGRKELKILEDEVKDSFDKLQKQAKHYADSAVKIRKIFLEYFFNTNILDSLVERPIEGQEIFNINEVSQALKSCLIDEEQLALQARDLKPEATLSLVDAFDVNIQESHLPLIRSKHGYIFHREIPYTTKAQQFMEQFAYALSIYRVCLGLFDVYYFMSQLNFVDTQPHYTYILEAETFKTELEKPDNGTPWLDSWQTAKAMKQKSNELSATMTGTLGFQQTIKDAKKRMEFLMGDGAVLLQDCYKNFPNTATLSIFFFDQWRKNSKTIADLLYPGKNSYSSYQGTLTVNDDCEQLQGDVEEFGTRLTKLKTALLRKGDKIIDACLSSLRIEAHCKQITIPLEAPEHGLFSYWGFAMLRSNNSHQAEKTSFGNTKLFTT
ncbi:hypothetical protein [Legionella hackeliae]|uniref:Coiled-coil protein n=1 Tax=Legionella hackeliae TaxID=449 RepID=A0A0A8UP48_LEGHA|nr:hypothetical protein [Legionella hackeliae]KTD13458.1 coiled-coil protein [Legionella hackeliae]CEK09301.1 protein of unknown function [Legionella hackeliae]STX49207.1 coiled-coil protein [Legionella hackeliae]